MRATFLLLVLVVLCLHAQNTQAAIQSVDHQSIDLTDSADANKKATWSEPDKIEITEDGLGRDGSANGSRDGWIQTKPIAVGYSFRPPSGVMMNVHIKPDGVPVTTADGRTYTPYAGNIFVRYSPDMKNWSTWQVLNTPWHNRTGDEPVTELRYTGSVTIPQCEQTAYREYLKEYAQLDVPWVDDEDAAVRWIIEKQPDFFERHLPLIGYVQVRHELSFRAGERIKSIDIQIGWAIGGRIRPRRNQNDPPPMDPKWHFKADVLHDDAAHPADE